MSSITLLSVICIPVVMSLKTGPRAPIHGAKAVQEILSNHLKYDGSLLSFLKGTKSNDTDGLQYADYNLDVNVLDIDNLRKLINLGKSKYKRSYRRMETRAYETAGYKYHKRPDPYDRTPSLFNIVIEKIYKLMLQSIYGTKYKIDDTKAIRKQFNDNLSYKIALLYTSMAHCINKMESLYAQARYFQTFTHFIYYLIIYEKLLQCDTDIDYAAARMYQLNDKYLLKKHMKGLNLLELTEVTMPPAPAHADLIGNYINVPGTPRPPTPEEIESIKQQQLDKAVSDIKAAQLPSIPLVPTFYG